MLQISAKLQNAEIYTVTLLKSVSITDAHPTISKILRTLTGNFSSGVSFGTTIGEKIGQVELLKRNATQNVFWKFSKTFKTSFCQHPLKMCEVRDFLVSSSNPITLIK